MSSLPDTNHHSDEGHATKQGGSALGDSDHNGRLCSDPKQDLSCEREGGGRGGLFISQLVALRDIGGGFFQEMGCEKGDFIKRLDSCWLMAPAPTPPSAAAEAL